MFSLILASGLAFAQSTYSTDQIAGSSRQFATFSAEIAPAFERLQGQLNEAGAITSEYERSVLLLGELAPASLREAMDGTRRTVNHGFLVAQRHAGLIQEDSERLFGEAIQRALASTGNESATECVPPRGMSSMMLGRRAPGCPGQNVSSAITEALDADTTLESELSGIAGVPWPEVAVEPAPQAPVSITGNSGWVSMGAIAALVEDEVGELEARFVASLNEQERTIEEQQALRLEHEGRMAELGARVVESARSAWRAEGLELAICATPEGAGSCPGDDSTAAGVSALMNRGLNL